MVELKGSEKQIAWAEQIRTKLLNRPKTFLEHKEQFLTFIKPEEKDRILEMIADIEEHVNYIENIEDAAFLIKQRFTLEEPRTKESIVNKEEYAIWKNNMKLLTPDAEKAIKWLYRKLEL